MPRNLGDILTIPIVTSLPGSGELGQILTLAGDGKQYGWDTATSTWKAVGNLPSGGTSGQALTKKSATDYDVQWSTVAAGGGSGAPEVYIGTDTPPAGQGYTVWVDTDETSPASLNTIMDTWHTVGAVGEPQFQNGYVATITVQFRKYPDGTVHIRGAVGTGTNSATVFTLPAGYRPVTGRYYYVVGDSGAAGNYVYVGSDGQVVPTRVGTTTHFGEIIFDTDAVNQAASAYAQPIEKWHNIGDSGEPAFTNGWGNHTGATGSTFASYQKDAFGKVSVRGIIANGTANTVVFTLPAGYRPKGTQRFIALGYSGSAYVFCYVYVDATGAIYVVSVGGAGAWCDLSTVEFDSETLSSYTTGAIIPSAASMPVSMDSWHNVGATGEPAFANSWANYGSGHAAAGFRKYPDGRVRLRGLLTSGTIGQPAFTLPVGYRPQTTHLISTLSSGGASQLYVNTDGTVNPVSGANAWYSLNGIEFDTETTPVTASVAVQAMDTWHNIGGTGEPAFTNSWSNYGSGYADGGFRKYPDGRVRLRGLVKTGTMNQSMFTLPAGYRPTRSLIFVVTSSDLFGEVRVNTDGTVIPYQGSNTWFALDGIEFDTELVYNYATAQVQPQTAAGRTWRVGGVATAAIPTSLTLIPDLTQTIPDLAGRPLLVTFRVGFTHTANTYYDIYPYLDGAQYTAAMGSDGVFGMQTQSNSAAAQVNAGSFIIPAGLSGAHTIELRNSSGAAGGNFFAGRRHLHIQEL
jgi:hypothetical protein